MYRIFFHPDTTKTQVSFDTTRKGAEVAAWLTARGEVISLPEPATREQIGRCHSSVYIDAIVTGEPADLASSQQFDWDHDTWTSVAAQNGAMIAATRWALEHGPAYALASGFHHARAGHGAGYCTFNGLAIAAAEALDLGVRQVVILDLDAHHGGGTYSLVSQWPGVLHLDIATAAYDNYRSEAPHRHSTVTDADEYLTTVEMMLTAAAPLIRPGDLLLYNAGMDIYEGCKVGGLSGITAAHITERERLVVAWAHAQQLRVAACMAGGYAGISFPNEDLIALHAASVLAVCRGA